MKAVSVFLEELQKRIDSTALQTLDFENKKNMLLEIDNIILKYNLNKRNITGEDLIRIANDSLDDLYTMIDFIYGEETKEVKEATLKNINTIKLFNEESDIAASNSVLYMSQIALRITQDLASCLKRDREYIDSQKEIIELPKRVLAMFDGETLKTPIFDYGDIDKLSLGLSSGERGKLKEELYIQSFDLVAHQMSKEDKQFLDKYGSIIKNKKAKYKDIYDKVSTEITSLDDLDKLTSELAGNLNLNALDIRQILLIKLLENKFNKYQEMLTKLGVQNGVYDNLLNLKSEMDDILAASRKKLTASEKTIVSSESNKRKEFDELVESAKEIITKEKTLIDSVKPEDLQRYLIDSVTGDNQDNTYKIVSILIELSREVSAATDKDKLFDGNISDIELNKSINNLKKYIETYEVLRKDKLKNNDNIIFLDSIVNEVSSLDKKALHSFKKVYDKLCLGDFSDVSKVEGMDYNIYASKNGSLSVAFMRLAGGHTFILHIFMDSFLLSDNDKVFIKDVISNEDDIYQKQMDLRSKFNSALNRSA